MENHMHKILNRLRPAFGLLRGGFKITLPAKVPADIESCLLNLIQHQSHDEAAETVPQLQKIESLGPIQEEPVDISAANTNPDDDDIEQEGLAQPPFTDGPSRFVLAKDGSKDCVALLVNETFLAKLRDLFQEVRDLSILEGPLCHANMDCRNIENSIQREQNALETAESEEKAEVHQKTLEQQTLELSKTRHWKDELDKERRIVKSNLGLSRSHTQWVLETAMREADLLGPEKPLPAILLRLREAEFAEDEAEEVSEQAKPTQGPTMSVASDHSEVEISQEERQRQAAYDDFIERAKYLDTVQEKFDDQKGLYQENLAEYQEMVAAGTIDMSRSDFDRRKVRYGQLVTRALIDAEEEFEEARERAHDLGAIPSDYGHEFYYGAEYEESWPENKIADFNASYDWGFVKDWMDSIPDSTSQADMDSVDIDEWDAEEVDVNDSISMIDHEEYRQEIDRYQRQCARLEDPCVEARLLGQPDAVPLERRYSFWM